MVQLKQKVYTGSKAHHQEAFWADYSCIASHWVTRLIFMTVGISFDERADHLHNAIIGLII